MKVVDIAAIATIAHQQPGIIVVVDNTFMSSYFQVSSASCCQFKKCVTSVRAKAICLQCLDALGWATGRASYQKTSVSKTPWDIVILGILP